MPLKKEKHQHASTDVIKSQITPLNNSTNTTLPTNESLRLENSYRHLTSTDKTNFSNDSAIGLDHLSLIRGHKNDLDELNNRFSNYVNALQKKSKENNDLQKKVDIEKQKQKHKYLATEDNHELDTQMNELRTEIDESAVLTEHFIIKHDRALKELALLKDKIRTEEDNSYVKRRPLLENEYQQTSVQLQELKRSYEDLEKIAQASKNQMNLMNDLYKKLEDELHDLTLNNIRLQNNLRTIEEQILFKKATYETEKAELGNEQTKQKQFYADELGKAIEDIKHDFQILLKHNKALLENSYADRMEQAKTQLLAYETTKQQQQQPLVATRASIDTLQNELKQVEKVRQDIDNEYRPLVDLYLIKQKEKNQTDEERIRLDNEYNRLANDVNHLTQAIEVGKQYWFSVHFELETYRKLLDLETSKSLPTINNNNNNNNNSTTSVITNNNKHVVLSNGKDEHIPIEEPRQIVTVKKPEAQRAISKSGEIKGRNTKNAFEEGSIFICNIILGKFDIDQVQAGFISINNAATHCVDQPLKGWTLVHTINNGPECCFQFADTYVLRARTRVRVYSNKVENIGNSAVANARLVAPSISAWTNTNQGDNVKIVLLDDKGINRAQYSETWQ
ncbi:unnamed protein product [Rotaria socialis]|uniref:LTD domain-containing protein n=1 Tax=Rotaria socialis TaxID=392032 RepID=A0A819X469_9BILA|nr:unnamed protein product [Rotaria socialis]CAF4207220.1 unnamed protein product [Rotaria socialis]CAF4734865.1 unnamed protein product [Rotaria socialis]